MNFQLKKLDSQTAVAEKSDVMLALVTEEMLDDKALKTAPSWLKLAAQARKDKLWDGHAGSVLNLYGVDGLACNRWLVAGAAKGTAREIRKAVMAGFASLKAGRSFEATLLLPAQGQTPQMLHAAVLAAADATYVYTTTKPSQKPRKLGRLTLGVAEPLLFKDALHQARALVAGIELTKEWGNRPGNYAKASDLANLAGEIAGRSKQMTCEILGPAQVAKLKMGSFIAVAQGSEEPLRFIVLKYQGAGKSEAPVVLVGKGITFDTGGISLKPGAEMDEMKFDMCGAASVLGTFEAIGQIQPRINVIGLIPACDNMPSGKAIKPGDVVTSMSGQTIEILNTDAEGRLILCDALTYAERFKPKAVIDIATLTGACVIALGAVRHGLFSSDDGLAQALLDAGSRSADLCWRMPLDDEYAEGLKSRFADVANVAGRAGGSVTAAKFLQRFAKAYPWAHLDIAGTAWKSGSSKGATGRPVGLLTQYLLDHQQEVATKPVRAKVAKT
jgi:leucyl aminopeptidase